MEREIASSREGLRVFGRALVIFAVLGLPILLIGKGCESADQSGWVTHHHDTPVWIQGNWMVGEFRDCEMKTTAPVMGVVPSPTVRAELPRLFCAKRAGGSWDFLHSAPDFIVARDALFNAGDWSELESEFHVLPVAFHGRIDRPDKAFVSWRCQRKSESLECKALD